MTVSRDVEGRPRQSVVQAAGVGSRTLQQHWLQYVVEGVVMMLIGGALAVAPHIATLATVTFIGWLLFIAGIFGILSSIGRRQVPGFWSSLALSLLTGLLGILLALQPVAAELTLTMVLAAYLFVHAIGMLTLAFSLRPATRRWLSLALSALVDLVLAGIMLAGWPGTATWVIGLIVGINVAFAGLGLTIAALGAHAEA